MGGPRVRRWGELPARVGRRYTAPRGTEGRCRVPRISRADHALPSANGNGRGAGQPHLPEVAGVSGVEPLRTDGEFPVPPAWRPTLEAVVAALARGEFRPTHVAGLEPVSEEAAAQMREYVADYGKVTLTGLTDDTWSTSVAQWWGDTWRVLVDLRTQEEGRSDLCLEVVVREVDGGYRFALRMLYVP